MCCLPTFRRSNWNREFESVAAKWKKIMTVADDEGAEEKFVVYLMFLEESDLRKS